MMPFLRKSKFPMINIAFIITIIYQNRFLLWSDVVIFRTIHYLGQWISVLNNSAMPSLVYNTSISYSPVLYTSVKKQLHPKISKVHWTWFSRIWHNILTQQATYGNRMDLTIIANNCNPPPPKKNNTRTNAKEHFNNLRQHASQKMVLCLQHHSNFEFARSNNEVFSRVGLVLESVGLATHHFRIARG